MPAATLPPALADLPVPGFPGVRLAAVADRLLDGSLPGFLRQLQRVRACQHPVRLAGQVDRVDPVTGELTPDFDSDDAPDGVVLVPCGNRRASRCPSCSDLYAGDAWQIVHAGLVGGLGLPDTVTEHPGLFVTVTAPSFGRVHSAGQGRPGPDLPSTAGLLPASPPGRLLRHPRPRRPAARRTALSGLLPLPRPGPLERVLRPAVETHPRPHPAHRGQSLASPGTASSGCHGGARALTDQPHHEHLQPRDAVTAEGRRGCDNERFVERGRVGVRRPLATPMATWEAATATAAPGETRSGRLDLRIHGWS